MSGSTEPTRDRRLADWLRRSSAVPTQTLFRVMNFELYSKGSAAIAIPGTVLFLGCLVYMAMEHSDAAVRKCEDAQKTALRAPT